VFLESELITHAAMHGAGKIDVEFKIDEAPTQRLRSGRRLARRL
jgi:hypothetical protein